MKRSNEVFRRKIDEEVEKLRARLMAMSSHSRVVVKMRQGKQRLADELAEVWQREHSNRRL